MKLYPVVCPYFEFPELKAKGDFLKIMEEYYKRKIFITRSAKTSLYLILKVLKKKFPNRNEVIIPAYTDSGLVLPIKKTGLRPVLVDVNLKDFGYDLEDLKRKINDKTLSIVLVHLFGIIQNPYLLKNEIDEEIILIEDFAQGFGGFLDTRKVGALCDISITSFGKGKNFALGKGGILILNKNFIKEVEEEYLKLPSPSFFSEILDFARYLILNFTTIPYLYGILYNFLLPFKSDKPPKNFTVSRNSNILNIIGAAVFNNSLEISLKVIYNWNFLYNLLKDLKGLYLFEYSRSLHIVLNRFPVIFKDRRKRFLVRKKLLENGFEANYFYLKPVHEHFDLGYDKDDFPNARYLADHLLTIPCHYKLKKDDIIRMVKIIKGVLSDTKS